MRGNSLVNLAATLVMLASVLVGGGYWLTNKQAQHQITFEKAVKETKE